MFPELLVSAVGERGYSGSVKLILGRRVAIFVGLKFN